MMRERSFSFSFFFRIKGGWCKNSVYGALILREDLTRCIFYNNIDYLYKLRNEGMRRTVSMIFERHLLE